MRQRTECIASKDVGKKIKSIRESKGLRIRNIANMTGLDFTFIKKVEIGASDPSLLTLFRILKALELDLRDFFNEEYICRSKDVKVEVGLIEKLKEEVIEVSLLKIIGLFFKKQREERKYSIKEFADLANIERGGYTKIEKGERNFSISLLYKIIHTLDIEFANVFPKDLYDKIDRYIEENGEILILNDNVCKSIDHEKLSEIFKNHRINCNLSQQKCAELLGLKRSVLNNIENNKAKITPEILVLTYKIFDDTLLNLLKILIKNK